MSKSSKARRPGRTTARKAERRPRGEIDRNFYFGDLLIKTGAATMVAMALIAAYTPFTLAEAIADGRYEYLGVMAAFGALGFIAFLLGRHLRREATHWDFD
jgi:hypothetical protein